MCREFFWPVDNFFIGREYIYRSRNFWLAENFLAGQECFSLIRDNLIGECRGSPVSEITVTITTAIIIF